MKRSLICYLPFLGRFIKNLNNDIGSASLPGGMAKTVARTHSRLIVLGRNLQTDQVLRGKPTIIVANHPNQADFFPLLAALPPRQNTFLVAFNEIMGLVPNLDKHLIPVYIKHKKPFSKRARVMQKFLETLHPSPNYSPDEAHQKNIQSIKTGSRCLEKGGLVAIFPGARSEGRKWKSGLGYLLKQVKRKDVFLVKVYIEGTSYLDYLRLLPVAGKFLPNIRIHFAQPDNINRIVNLDLEPREIVSKLECSYFDWVINLASAR